MNPRRALILVDIQNDFLPGGALAVPAGDEVVAVANALIPYFGIVAATQDWHPATHSSFAANHPGRVPGDRIDLNGLPQVLWPVHCVENRHGSEFASALLLPANAVVVRKGTDVDVDSYSGFYDNGRRHATTLEAKLRELGVAELTVMGLATDYCVKYTVLDALRLGFSVSVVREGCRAVNLNPGDGDAAEAEMQTAGAHLVSLTDALNLAEKAGRQA
ncbi:MAG: bifunctional nicotinamidase/pyrazinamidase [Armatimonadetes bacterium]|nr:bifunctional nicotinamidase/pyrazinamidase [Armatimonadota bacterium]MDE2205860.1 bifunctional nicotinamidase/pyrazinamidase [Armatimonadota bacterium]